MVVAGVNVGTVFIFKGFYSVDVIGNAFSVSRFESWNFQNFFFFFFFF